MYRLSDKIVAFLPPEDIEPEVRAQLENLAAMPFIHRHVAVMPDCHLGRGATVGSVIATDGAIIPAAVGVDIGCGMIAVRTKFQAARLPDDLHKLHGAIERGIPLSAGGYNKEMTGSATARVKALAATAREHYAGLTRSGWEVQLGSLGGGNHFIEVCLDEAERVWIVLHSGSRGIGNQLAQFHIKAAQALMDEGHIALADRDLAWLPESVPGFRAYMDDLHWAQEFALLNREEMMDRVLAEFSHAMYGEDGHQAEIECERINCHHNFTQRERHFGADVWITRKGAIQMKRGQKGVIPGSMGTRSYIVSGLENACSYHSAPHGAGRRMSRTAAKKRFTLADLEAQMGGVVYRPSKAFVDEIPAAYKDIDEVMENAKELVAIEHTLRQIINVKGS
jgi:tRNA-splicing ligase RtcB